MKLLTKFSGSGEAVAAALFVAVIVFIFAVGQWMYLRKAHSTFENYYAFRGCIKLVDKTDTYGHCKLSSGNVIKLVKFNDKWYLDGDLPWACLGSVCFGI